MSRLRSECYPATGDVCVAKSPRNAYTYDLVGNRTSETSRTVVGTKATTVTTDCTYDAADELLTKSVAGTATVMTALIEFPQSCSADSSGRRYTDLF